MKKEELKKFLELSEPIFVAKFAPILAPYAKIIYLIGLGVLALSILGALVTLLTGEFTAAVLGLLVIAVEFVLIRMFCEFLLTHGK